MFTKKILLLKILMVSAFRINHIAFLETSSYQIFSSDDNADDCGGCKIKEFYVIISQSMY